MSVDAIALLPSNPRPHEIAAAIGSAFGIETDVKPAGPSGVHGFFYVLFDDPAAKGSDGEHRRRRLAVFADHEGYDEVIPGRKTLCSLTMAGSSAAVVDALGAAFGGHVCHNDGVNGSGWTRMERTAPEGGTDTSPLYRLLVEVEAAAGPAAASALAEIARDPAALSTVTDACARYLDSLDHEASMPSGRP